MKLPLVFVFCLLVTTLGMGQNGAPLTIGKSHLITSTHLNKETTIQVYTPDSHSDGQQDYPVLYVLDGQRYFLSGVGIQEAIRSPRAIPEMIVVGITMDESERWTWFGDKTEKFTSFLIEELVTFINANYRTNGDNILFGWEAGAYYASDLILRRPEVFNGAIVSNGGYASEETVKSFNASRNTYLYMANSKRDIYNIGETDAFHQTLKVNKPENLVWKYDLQNDEVHESLAHPALYKGLKFYYHNYNSLAFESIQQYVDLGGMQYLKTYFKERAKRFGGDSQIDNSTKNTLIWLAWNKDNFEYFSLFMREFQDVLQTKRYASAYWQNRLGQFYLKHKDYRNAIKHFNTGLTKYTDPRFDEQMKEGLAKAKSLQH